VGLNGTSHSAPQSAQTALCISRGPPNRPPNLFSLNAIYSPFLFLIVYKDLLGVESIVYLKIFYEIKYKSLILLVMKKIESHKSFKNKFLTMVKVNNLVDDFIKKSRDYHSLSVRERNGNRTDWIGVFLDVASKKPRDYIDAIESILRKIDDYVKKNYEFGKEDISRIVWGNSKDELETIRYYLMISGHDDKSKRDGRVKQFITRTMPNLLFTYFNDRCKSSTETIISFLEQKQASY
jgi:hypothetical protein